MGCGCGKKNTAPDGTVHFMGRDGKKEADPADWGPILWKYLHCMAEKCGASNNRVVDADQANCLDTLLSTLHLILPCTECQAHAAAYLAAHPLPPLKDLQGSVLRDTARDWLFQFHNHVRSTKGQPVTIRSAQECSAAYAACFVPKCEHTAFTQSVAYAVRQGWVRIEHWRKWYSTSEKCRLVLGNIVV